MFGTPRVGPGVSPASPWTRATPRRGQPKGEKKIYTIHKKKKKKKKKIIHIHQEKKMYS
jgi:hypothetical protein